MDTFVRDVAEIDPADRPALEHVLGRPLRGDEQLVIRVSRPAKSAQPEVDATRDLPDWCDVYAGLSDEEVADLDRTILTRAELCRPDE